MNEFINVSPVFYGMSIVPLKFWQEYGFALLTIAGADGDVSDPEQEWLTEDLASALKVPDLLVDKWKHFDWRTANLEEIFGKIKPNQIANYNKLLLYDAIRMSYADGDYSDQERESVYDCARILQVNKETVMVMEALVETERAADKLRQILL